MQPMAGACHTNHSEGLKCRAYPLGYFPFSNPLSDFGPVVGRGGVIGLALFLIKGMSIAEIARMRGSFEGMIKAQSAVIYRKANVTGKTLLVSVFVEAMFEG